jgi:hypothetical protein
MQTLIRLKIERFIEDGQEYFVATSEDLQGLVTAHIPHPPVSQSVISDF